MTAPSAPHEHVQVRRHGPAQEICEIALDRPEAKNAISTAMAAELGAVTRELASDDSVRVVVLSSSRADVFSVGADLKERAHFSDADILQQRPTTRGAYQGVRELPMPVIVALEGYALGGGLELALSCDLIVASSEATIGLPEVRVGLIPGGGGTQLLTRRIGWSKAASMIFTGDRLSGGQGHDLGVIDVVTPAGQAHEQALLLAERIAQGSPRALREAKRAMQQALDADLNTGIEREDAGWRACATSADRREGIAAFLAKRPPIWPPPPTA